MMMRHLVLRPLVANGKVVQVFIKISNAYVCKNSIHLKSTSGNSTGIHYLVWKYFQHSLLNMSTSLGWHNCYICIFIVKFKNFTRAQREYLPWYAHIVWTLDPFGTMGKIWQKMHSYTIVTPTIGVSISQIFLIALFTTLEQW